jgi:hypothetical protein
LDRLTGSRAWASPLPKTYLYTAIGFSAGVETLNQLAVRGR